MDLENRAGASPTAEQLGRYIGERIKKENPKLIEDLGKLINNMLPKPWYVRAYESIKGLFYSPRA